MEQIPKTSRRKGILFFLTLIFVFSFDYCKSQSIIEIKNYKWEKRDLVRAYDNAFIKKDGIGMLYINMSNISRIGIKAMKFNIVIYDVFEKKIVSKKNCEINDFNNFSSNNYYFILDVADWPPPISSIYSFKNDVEIFNSIERNKELKIRLKIKNIVFEKEPISGFARIYTQNVSRFF